MGKVRKVYTREFKVEAVRLLEESELSVQREEYGPQGCVHVVVGTAE